MDSNFSQTVIRKTAGVGAAELDIAACSAVGSSAHELVTKLRRRLLPRRWRTLRRASRCQINAAGAGSPPVSLAGAGENGGERGVVLLDLDLVRRERGEGVM
ncbi:hypothetical protein E2562_001777 [Oryza meyeriana var. granulata]|uniref:Uncharacterized protein n=1 Tax=Oryza meyeriana var. granulata TaxID=110450 RepID=A0A6G1CD57_9ORYZ|nr:hypothetical protein E2562_001777 [Oryza meyeriana var. granulata]